jgi:ferritin-like metal-binding protein YciE
MESLNELFLHILRDVYFAEKAIAKALPKLARQCTTPALAEAFLQHREETMTQAERLEDIFQMCGARAKAETCEAIKGLLDEADEVIEEFAKGPVRDAGLLACAQAIEHYEMGRYGALIAWAQALGMKEAASLLQQTLEEEKKADALLSKMAKAEVNRAAAEAGGDDDQADDEDEDEAAPAMAGAPARRRRARD